MQIRMFTENNINVTVGRAAQEKHQFVQASSGVFGGAQCKVTISKEGRKLSEQSDSYAQKSVQRLKAEKMMEQEKEQKEQSKATQSEYSDLLKEINKIIKSMKNSNMAGADKETIEKKQQVISAIHDQKQKQIEENQKKAKEAQQMAMQSSEMQDEIDEKNRDLLIMLKSIEEAEKAEEEREGGKTQEGGSSDNKMENNVSDVIQNSATQFATSSMKREMNVVGMINALNEDGRQYLARADEIARNAFTEADSIEKLLNDENYTDAEKKNAVTSYGEKMARNASVELEILLSGNYTDAEKEKALERYRASMEKDSDFSDYRRRGLQMVRDAKECKSEHNAENPLQGMEETKDSMIQSAVDAAFNEASQGKLDENSQELADEVKELIDERNDIDHAESEEDEEIQEEIVELPEPEEDKENIKETDEEQDSVTQG